MLIPKSVVKFRLSHTLVRNKSNLRRVSNVFFPVARKFTTDFFIILYGKFPKFALYHSHFPGNLKAGSAVDDFVRNNVSHQTSTSKMETHVPHRNIYISIQHNLKHSKYVRRCKIFFLHFKVKINV